MHFRHCEQAGLSSHYTTPGVTPLRVMRTRGNKRVTEQQKTVGLRIRHCNHILQWHASGYQQSRTTLN